MPGVLPSTAVRLGATAALLLGFCITAVVAVHAALYVVRRRAAPGMDACGADAAAAGAPVVRLVLTETAASFWLACATLWPVRFPIGDPARARRSVLLAGPAWLPRRGLAVLARHLAREGTLVDAVRLPARGDATALARAAARADALRRRAPAVPLTIVCYDCAGTVAAALLALLPRRAVARLVLLAVPTCPAPPPAVPTVTMRAAGDPWHAGAGGPRAEGPEIELAGIGHLALLVAPHVADVVRDACASDGGRGDAERR